MGMFTELKNVHWGATVKLALARGFLAGAVLILVIVAKEQSEVERIFIVPPIWAIVGICSALIFHFVGRIFAMFIPMLGALIMFFGSLMICAGDPILYFINKQWPKLFGITDLKFLNLRPLILVMHHSTG
jgi:hypothetical protein